MFSFQRSYIYFANTHTHTHTKKLFVALLTTQPPLQPLFSPLPACCKPSQLPCPALPPAAAIVRCGSVAFIEYSLLFVFSLYVCVCVCNYICTLVCLYVCLSVCVCVACFVCQNNGFLCTFYLAGNGCKRKVIGKIREKCRKSWRKKLGRNNNRRRRSAVAKWFGNKNNFLPPPTPT